eukprot:4846071-Pyramimonas_sp.AAC.1
MLLRLRTIIPEGDLRNLSAEAERGRAHRRLRYSRDPKNCRGAEGGCNRQRRGLTDAEKLKRDKYEQAKLDAGQSLGYERT